MRGTPIPRTSFSASAAWIAPSVPKDAEEPRGAVPSPALDQKRRRPPPRHGVSERAGRVVHA